MLKLFTNPAWIDSRLFRDQPLEEVPDSLFAEITEGFSKFASEAPLASIVIPALNEEFSILRTLHSLSKNRTQYPVEILVVNNNSTDRTQEVLDRLQVKSYFQPVPGWGPARQMGQEQARGRYVLMADADCFYPPTWIEHMLTELQREGVTCVYGGYKFLAAPGQSRLRYVLYEGLRGIVAEVRNLRRPWFNCVGMCMGYVRALGLRVGFIKRKIRGEDGRMCFELAQLGRIVRIRSGAACVWTFPRTLQKDGNLLYSLMNRAYVEFFRFSGYFRKQPVHDTHTSENFQSPIVRYFHHQKQNKPQEETVD